MRLRPKCGSTARGQRIDVALLRAFLKRALEDDAVVEEVNDLLFDHIVGGGSEDWRAVADELVAQAREVVG